MRFKKKDVNLFEIWDTVYRQVYHYLLRIVDVDVATFEDINVSLFIILLECIINASTSFQPHTYYEHADDYFCYINEIEFGRSAGLIKMLNRLFGHVPQWQVYAQELQYAVYFVGSVSCESVSFLATSPFIVLYSREWTPAALNDNLLTEMLESTTIRYLRTRIWTPNQLYLPEWHDAIEVTMRQNRTRFAMTAALICAASHSSTAGSSLTNNYIWFNIAEFLYAFTTLDKKHDSDDLIDVPYEPQNDDYDDYADDYADDDDYDDYDDYDGYDNE